MKKLKDFGSFITEKVKTNNEENNLNENIWSELFSNAASLGALEQVYYWAGIAIDALAVGAIGTGIVKVTTSGVLELLKNNKLGERGKEFAEKVIELGKKGAELFKTKQKDESFPEQVNSEFSKYQDVIGQLNNGELGEEGVNLAKKVTNAKEAAEEV